VAAVAVVAWQKDTHKQTNSFFQFYNCTSVDFVDTAGPAAAGRSQLLLNIKTGGI
jgi:hypothetical protein